MTNSTPSSYAGDIDLASAWQRLETDPTAVLVDVRTNAEWTLVGRPRLDSIDRTVGFVEWASWPDMNRNADFVEAVAELVESREQPVLLLCRSGGRSRAAAELLTEAGFTAAFNVTGGFEGDLDPAGHRRGGWRDELPWTQA